MVSVHEQDGLSHLLIYRPTLTCEHFWCTKMFLLDTLDSMPRLRVSDTLMKVFLWVLKESGASNVPSLGQLRQVQATLRDSSGISSKLCKSTRNNVFYMNDIKSIIAMVCCLVFPSSLSLVNPMSGLRQPQYPTTYSDLS